MCLIGSVSLEKPRWFPWEECCALPITCMELLFSMSSPMHSSDLQAGVLQDVALLSSKVPSTVGPYNRGQGAGSMMVRERGWLLSVETDRSPIRSSIAVAVIHV